MADKKASLPAPIDRPLSRAYLREYTGWSTEFAPGMSPPTSLRKMENLLVERDGALSVRPGLKYLSYEADGKASQYQIVGTHEVFFLNDGSKAYLFAVRDTSVSPAVVNFRVLLDIDTPTPEIVSLTDVRCGFTVDPDLPFSELTTYVKYLQLDNKIIALSNAGETARVFYVGANKEAKKVDVLASPQHLVSDMLTVVHPRGDWINGTSAAPRKNLVTNPSFEVSLNGWMKLLSTSSMQRVAYNLVGSYIAVMNSDRVLGDPPRAGYSAIWTSCKLIETYNTRDLNIRAKVRPTSIGGNFRIRVAFYDSGSNPVGVQQVQANQAVAYYTWHDLQYTVDKSLIPATTYWYVVFIETDLLAGNWWNVDGVLVEEAVPGTTGEYFSGDTPMNGAWTYAWTGTPDDSVSTATKNGFQSARPAASGTTANTLISSTAGDNDYNVGFAYTAENEFGESIMSMVTFTRIQRAWDMWKLETSTNTVNAEPTGTATGDRTLMVDQLVAMIPNEPLWDYIKERAVRWNLYMMMWSDQDNVPVEMIHVGTREIVTKSYQAESWISVAAPDVMNSKYSVPIPQSIQDNFSDPWRGSNGLVASDRMILVHDPTRPGQIKWTSNNMGEYLNSTSWKGGGFKTLTSGNLYIPSCVKLWQNPESKDSLIVMCEGVDSYSTSYYMAPAEVGQQSDSTLIMGFEETTATPGTVSPYGCEVLNNSLYHPLEQELMKSTASNYNINHKTMTDQIANKWTKLADLHNIVSSQMDNRLYYLVHNPEGEELEDGCWGNEVWILDTAAETGTWSRWLVQGHALRKVTVNGKLHMSIVKHDGIYYFDEAATQDEYVAAGRTVSTQIIPWLMETNTQGANRAHDAWARVQQVNLNLLNWVGKVNWGIRGFDLNGRMQNVSKVTKDLAGPGAGDEQFLRWDFEDYLLVRRDMKEWFFYASNRMPDSTLAQSTGSLGAVQYRYTPVSVNVGYEYGSVETFEYSRNRDTGFNETLFKDGVPANMVDRSRP